MKNFISRRFRCAVLSAIVLYTFGFRNRAFGAENSPVFLPEPAASELTALRAALDDHGFEGLMVYARQNGIPAPLMPSRWYVDHLHDAIAREYYDSARAFGLAVINRVDADAPLMLQLHHAELLHRGIQFIDLADWIGATEGYGNIQIARHASDVGTTGLAQLVADPDYPLTEVAPEVRRLSNVCYPDPFPLGESHCVPWYDTPTVRARVINFEAGGPLFDVGTIHADQDLKTMWGLRRTRRIYLSGEWKQLEPALGPFPMVQQLAKKAGFDLEVNDPLDVFPDFDTDCRVGTLAGCWDVPKRYEATMLQRNCCQNPSNLQALLTFREAVGGIPPTPDLPAVFTMPKPADLARKPFDDAWKRVRGQRPRELAWTAFDVYRSVRWGRLIDQDTQARQIH